jgi:hypothetical protein
MATAVLTITVLVLLYAGAQPHPRSTIPRVHGARPAMPASRAPRAGGSGTQPTAGQGLSWADFHGIQLPVSFQDGPHRTRDGLAWGFADTPRGALLAAINIAVRTAALWGPAIYQPTIRHQVTGPDAAALLSADASDYAQLRAAAHVRAGKPAGRGYAAETAYRFDAYSPADATVDIVTAGPGSGGTTVLAATRIEATWRRGDWRVVAPPGGDWGNSATSVSSLTGYTTFPGEE